MRRACYFACRFDNKARAEANAFSRWYQCRFICESCMAQRPTERYDHALTYRDFRYGLPRHLTEVSHETYLATEPAPSPWARVPGWTLGTCLHDIMHNVYLGVGRDLVSSLLADFLDHDCLAPAGTLEEKLKQFSVEMLATFKEKRTIGLIIFALESCVRWFNFVGCFQRTSETNKGYLCASCFSPWPTLGCRSLSQPSLVFGKQPTSKC